MAASEFVQEAINKNKIVIFSKTYCPYCNMAKKAFDSLKSKYTTIELDKRDDGDDIQDALNKVTSSRTVPQVFVNGKFLGGGTDVKQLKESGKLADLIAE